MLEQRIQSEATHFEKCEQLAVAMRLPFALLRELVVAGTMSPQDAAAAADTLVLEFPPEWREDMRAEARKLSLDA